MTSAAATKCTPRAPTSKHTAGHTQVSLHSYTSRAFPEASNFLTSSNKPRVISSLCRGETLQVQLGRLHVEVRPFRRADETLPQAHGSQTVPLSRLWPQLLPLWPPGFTQETTPPSVKPSAVQLECNSVLGSVLDYTTLTLKWNSWPYLDCDREWGNVSSGLMFKPFHLIKPKRGEKKAGCQLTHLRPAHFYRNMVAEPNLWSAVEGPDTFFSFCLQLLSWPESSALLWLHNQNSSSVCASHMACSQASQRNMISSFKAFCFTCIQVNVWDLDTHLQIHIFFARYANTMWNVPECILSRLLCIVS